MLTRLEFILVPSFPTASTTHIFFRIALHSSENVQCPPLILAPLVNMSKGGCENESASFYCNDILFKKFTKTIEVKQLKLGRKCHDEINVFLSFPTIIGTPRNMRLFF